VENAASRATGAISPGEVVTLLGSGFSANARVTFDGHAAPIVYTRSTQINLVTPYEIVGKTSTSMVVQAAGAQTAPQSIPVAAASPGIFMVVNPNGKANATVNPAPRASVVVLYATGFGETNPPGVDGKISTSPYPKPVLAVTVTVGGVNAHLLYCGAEPNVISGMMEVKVQLPAGVSGSAVPLVLNIGGFQTKVHLAIQ